MASLIKRIRAKLADQKRAAFVDIWKAGGLCVISYENPETGEYETRSVCVYAMSHLTDTQWIGETDSFLTELEEEGVY